MLFLENGQLIRVEPSEARLKGRVESLSQPEPSLGELRWRETGCWQAPLSIPGQQNWSQVLLRSFGGAVAVLCCCNGTPRQRLQAYSENKSIKMQCGVAGRGTAACAGSPQEGKLATVDRGTRTRPVRCGLSQDAALSAQLLLPHWAFQSTTFHNAVAPITL